MSERKEPDAFEVASGMVAKRLGRDTADPTSPRGKLYGSMLQTVLIVRAIDRLAGAVRENTKAVEAASPFPVKK